MFLGWSGLCFAWGHEACRRWFQRELIAIVDTELNRLAVADLDGRRDIDENV